MIMKLKTGLTTLFILCMVATPFIALFIGSAVLWIVLDCLAIWLGGLTILNLIEWSFKYDKQRRSNDNDGQTL